MLLSKSLNEIEQFFDFKYPPSFTANIKILTDLSQTPAFAQFIPQTQFLLTLSAVKTAFADGLPPDNLPFLLEKQPNHNDYYGFDIHSKAPELAVALFASHAIVETWPNFAAFLDWLKVRLQSV